MSYGDNVVVNQQSITTRGGVLRCKDCGIKPIDSRQGWMRLETVNVNRHQKDKGIRGKR